MTPDGLTTCASAFGPAESGDRLAAEAGKRGMIVVVRIDHALAAAGVGLALGPTEVIIFGNPKAGTPLMQAAQTLGIDLPLKVLIWQDAEGTTWVSYNEPRWLARRHGIVDGDHAPLPAMSDTLAAIVLSATTDGGAAPPP